MRAAVVGAYRNFDEINQVGDDVVTAGIISFVLMFLLLWFFVRKIANVFLVQIPLFVAMALTTAATYIIYSRLTILTAFILTLIFGLGIEYTVHLYSRWAEENRKGLSPLEAMVAAVQSTGRALLAGAATNIFAMLSLQLGHFKGFKEFGVVVSIGITLAMISTWLVIPPVFFLASRIGDWVLARVKSRFPRYVVSFFLPTSSVKGRPAAAQPAPEPPDPENHGHGRGRVHHRDFLCAPHPFRKRLRQPARQVHHHRHQLRPGRGRRPQHLALGHPGQEPGSDAFRARFPGRALRQSGRQHDAKLRHHPVLRAFGRGTGEAHGGDERNLQDAGCPRHRQGGQFGPRGSGAAPPLSQSRYLRFRLPARLGQAIPHRSRRPQRRVRLPVRRIGRERRPGKRQVPGSLRHGAFQGRTR